ncbi:MIP/aquaporin family protein [Meiothermus hypogaeus]|uniref:Glycerol uptake facilitator protein n=2 Tax=Meiothermus hypogaeus TaxID=884155 RepID=A0A511R6G1_9DEIN|nr:aquaporin [Meiothermus hypogaeus]RIH76947.1 Aquaporin Z 2 [Meiothermus hypogaeus]GEM85185.1 glycerol uptake facilitator protein [Meiothermus hypogaeus NBRC 106114]
MNIRALIAEFLGVFALCFVGIGAIAATQGGDLMVVALAHGLAIGLSVVALGALSGGHFNPAVTFGMLITGRISPVGAVGYWVAQLLGGLVAAFFIGALYGGTAVADGTPAPGANHTAIQALMMEIFLTFFLVSVIFGSAVFNNYSYAGLAIGLAITMDILAGGAISGAAMNPARVLGPAIIGGEWSAHWVYWAGPLVGAGLAALLYDFLYSKKADS